MARRRKGRARRRLLWVGLVALAVAVGFVAGHLYQGVREPPPTTRAPTPSDVYREIVGPLDPGGTRVAVASRDAAKSLRERLAAAARQDGGRLVEVSRREDALRVEVRLGETRYPVELWWPLAPPPLPPRLAIVIDDLGRSLEEALGFLELPLAVTPAILPHLPMSQEVARLARERGREFLLHLPMQPQGYPTQNPGEGALLETMGEAEVRRVLARDLAAVAGAAGVNNHMGSRYTELEAPMAWVMRDLAARGLYFLDSVTSPRSVAAREAGRVGLPWARRDVFLDNERDEEAIGRQVQRAIDAARAKGFAVAIGHPHGATRRALARWAPAIEAAGVKVVPLSEGLRRGDGA